MYLEKGSNVTRFIQNMLFWIRQRCFENAADVCF